MAIKIISTTCPEANIINSGSTYSDSAPAGTTFELPNVTNIDSDGSSVLTPAQVGFTASTCDPATIINSGSTYTATTAAGTTFELPNVTNIDSDGSSVLTPAIVGFTASTAGATVVLTVSDASPNFGDTVVLTVTPTGMTPSSYRFWIPQQDNTYRIVTQATNTYSWKVDIYGAWTVRGGANTLDASAYDIDGVDIMSRHVVAPYARPSDWITIPSINVGGGEEVSYCLMQVFDTSQNYMAVTCEGDFTVDWGDGSTPVDYTSATKAEKSIAYADVSNLSTRGYRQALIKITPQSGQNLTKVDYAVRHTNETTANISSQILEIDQHLPNATTFKIYSTLRHHYYLEQFNWRGTHSVTVYRELFRDCQRLQSIVSLSWANVGDCYRLFYNAKMLRILPEVNLTSCTVAQEMFRGAGIEWFGDVTITGTVTNYDSLFRSCALLIGIESITINPLATAVTNFYSTCEVLRYAPLFSMPNANSLLNFHDANYLLEYIPPYDTPNITSLSAFARQAYSLRQPCKFASPSTTANVTTLYRCYYNAFSLTTAMRSGEHDLSSVITAQDCYHTCRRMRFSHTVDLPSCVDFNSFQKNCRFEEVEVFDTSAGINLSYFLGGWSGKVVPLFDTSSAQSLFAAFQYCRNLEEVAAWNTSNVTEFKQCFFYTQSLYQLPNWDFSLGTNFYRFNGYGKIARLNLGATSAPTNLKEVLRGNSHMEQIEDFDWSSVTDTTNAFRDMHNLRRVIGCECPVNISFLNCYALQAAEIDEIFNDLPTVIGKTITVTGCAGASTCTPSIAQAKGWAVSN